MTIEYPRQFPQGIYIRTLMFQPVQPVTGSRLGDGTTKTISEPRSFWRGSWQTQVLSGEKLLQMNAWLNSLKGGAKQFWGKNTHRCGLLAHDDLSTFTLDGQPFDAMTEITAFNNASNISIHLPAALQLKAGDRFELSQGETHSLVEVMEPVTATAQGDYAVEIAPPLPIGVYDAGSSVNLSAARARMTLSPPGFEGRVESGGERFTWSGIESL